MRKVGTLAKYSGIVLGAPLFMFHWHKDALGFLSRHRRELVERPVAVFVLGPVHDPHDEKEWEASRSQLNKDLAKHPWFKPIALEMFGGKYDPAKLGFPLNKMAGKEPASDIREGEHFDNYMSKRVRQTQRLPTPALQVEERMHHPTSSDW